MNDELANKLNEKYPKIFHKESRDGKVIPFYFECGDGWYNIIDSLCAVLQHKIDWNNAEGKYSAYKPKEPRKQQVVAYQVKEKFGGLRFYAMNMDEEMLGALNVAEAMSTRTCETCGSPGTCREDANWIITICDSCLTKQKEGQNEDAR
jgi:hypothetical protein